MNARDQRSEARVNYPRPSKSGFLFGADALDVLDLSERGFRFMAKGAAALTDVGQRLCGIVCLRHGETVAVSGTVVRILGREVAVQSDEIPIPFEQVLAERLFLETGRTGLVLT
jgi:hypothetical protein